MATKRTISIPIGIDAHAHFRDGDRLMYVVPYTADQFGYAIVMPNLSPKHVTTVSEALSYRKRIVDALPRGADFTPLMTTSLTKEVSRSEFIEVMACPDIHAVKLYAGHTTNAEGVDDLRTFDWAFEMLEKAGKPLLLHGEAGTTVDVFDREQRFYETEGQRLISTFSGLKVVCEHITTKFLADFVHDARTGVCATITPQHLLSNRNDMLGKGGIRPDLYCMPILKREEDRVALLRVATSGNPKYFLGTDSAPHARFGLSRQSKYSACGCAGSYSAPYALHLYTEAFASVDALDQLAAFASLHGLAFYGLQAKPGLITIEEIKPSQPLGSFPFGEDADVAPYMPFDMIRWQVRRTS